MRLLVTNDDGVHAPGLHALARELVDAGHDVVVAAPIEDRSGSGAGIGAVHLGEGIGLERFEVNGLESVPVFGIDGPPALAVMGGQLGAFGPPPDIVVSGINPGPNTGRAVLHSGTVGAALTAANFGISGLAVSAAIGEPMQWVCAAKLARLALDWLADQPARTVVNLNTPDLPIEELRGVRWARLAPFGTVRAALAESSEGRLQVELRETGVELKPDTDTALVGAGYAAMTCLTGIRAADDAGVAEYVARRLADGR